MAETANVVRRYSVCHIIDEVTDILNNVMGQLQGAEKQLTNARTGECLVKNSSYIDVEKLCDLAKRVVQKAENVRNSYSDHLQSHPKQPQARPIGMLGQGRGADSGYSSQTQSTLLDGVPIEEQGGIAVMSIQEHGDNDDTVVSTKL